MQEEEKTLSPQEAKISVDGKTTTADNQPTQKAVNSISLYERIGERATQPFALQMLDMLQPIADLDLLDVAAGTGGLALVAAERGARVLATDVNPVMVDRTRERLRSYQHGRAEIMDFSLLNLNDASYDVAVSNFGVLAFSNWRIGLAEMIRVIRQGGRIGLAMWTHWDDCSPAHLLKRVFRDVFPNRALWREDMFPLFTQETLHTAIQEAGCTDVCVEVATTYWSPFSSEDVVSEADPMFKGFPGYAALLPAEAERLQAALQPAFRSYAGGDGIIRLPTKAFVVIGRRHDVQRTPG